MLSLFAPFPLPLSQLLISSCHKHQTCSGEVFSFFFSSALDTEVELNGTQNKKKKSLHWISELFFFSHSLFLFSFFCFCLFVCLFVCFFRLFVFLFIATQCSGGYCIKSPNADSVYTTSFCILFLKLFFFSDRFSFSCVV